MPSFSAASSSADRNRTEEPFWFPDGNIVLGVECKQFKVHRSKLMCSLIFADMLELPQPELVENVDGSPVVNLPHDTVNDWRATLHWMYDRKSFELRSTTFNIIAGALRISTKYEIPDLRLWCRRQLLSIWPIDLARMNTTALPNAAEAVCLARELDVPEILPAAFYALSVQRWSIGMDGGRNHLILSPDDLRRLIIGREHLQDRLLSLLANRDSKTGSEIFRLCNRCHPSCIAGLSSYLQTSTSSPYGSWLFRDLRELSLGVSVPLQWCDGCGCAVRLWAAIRDFLDALQVAMPKYFLL
ncbi:hypothetical protein HYDPIDRAFT_90957 [Hydnomerulius pinastri MD-312]|uniref:BTB domain-containing protein n=1 Tax=Hydnomerulius pinastri MD-312 TaxID=994086 RepID=A0A0C9W0N0_9AGAM|nr:hypothetical protein HYDPIDRAFT_90957 [Hydnomerulius pinastri MD-312]